MTDQHAGPPVGAGIFGLLADEHAELEDLMRQVAGTMEVRVRQDLFPGIRQRLLGHARGEEEAFYPRLAEHRELRDLVAQSLEEHAEVERYLKRLDVKDKSTKQWRDLFVEMMQTVEAHVLREERELFPQAHGLVGPDQARQMKAHFDQVEDEGRFR